MMEGPIQLSLGIRLHLELRQDMIPLPGLYPAVEAGGDALPGTKLPWDVAPGRSGAIHPLDSLHHGAMVFGGTARFQYPCRQQRVNSLPLLVGQYLVPCPVANIFENGP
jgi:hypothetical protein